MRLFHLALCFLALLAVPLSAAELVVPTGPVVLTVSGQIGQTNVGDTAQFDLAMLDALPQRTTQTKTPWYDASRSFSGVVASALFETLGAQGTMVTVTALNDYSADIPMSDFIDHPVILASRLDGAELSVRDKGPLFIIYPFDTDAELYNEVYFSRSVWQLKSITVH